MLLNVVTPAAVAVCVSAAPELGPLSAHTAPKISS